MSEVAEGMCVDGEEMTEDACHAGSSKMERLEAAGGMTHLSDAADSALR